MKESRVRYSLRRTMPPWQPKETIDELIEFAPRYRLDEVIFKIDVEEFSHGLPTVEMIAPCLPWLKEARERLGEIGVAMSINPWVTLVHCDRGRDCRKAHPDVDWMVGHDGVECTACACPLSPGWRALMDELYRLYASVHPRVLWLEDDIRTFNHQPVTYGCFCDLHLAEFERRTGLKRTREELVANILASGEPHPDRAAWLDLMGETMVDVARVFEQAVHGVSPETQLGLMTSHPNHHALEGRRWRDFTSTLAGGLPLAVRPCMGNYEERNARGLYDSSHMVRRTLACLGGDLEIQTELESFPFTLYSKSAAFTRLQLLFSFALGSDAATMNLFDHAGSAMEAWPQYGRMLAATRPLVDAVADRCRGKAADRGVGVLHHPRGSYAIRLSQGAEYDDLAHKDSGWMRAIESLGMSATFEPAPLRAVTGQILRAYSKDEVEALLSQGVLLDLGAAETLMDLGLADKIGVRSADAFHKLDRPMAAEEYEEGFGGPATYSSLTNLTPALRLAALDPAPGARAVSHFVDPDRERVMPGMVLFENDLGGRVAV